ncbi:hypothetical protein QL285_044810 [Trifolium repens]|nr:hypothetical protein QL285_044810 [Trifolium repens]
MRFICFLLFLFCVFLFIIFRFSSSFPSFAVFVFVLLPLFSCSVSFSIFWLPAGLAAVAPVVRFFGGCGDTRCGSGGLCGPSSAVGRFDGVVVVAGGVDVVVGYWC